MTLLNQYFKEEQINGIANSTLKNLKCFFGKANEFKPLDSWNKNDVNDYIINLQKDYKKGTVELSKRRLKKFFKWAGKSDIVDHIKVKMVKNALQSSDILTTDEINILIDNTPSTLYKALIAFLFESGARINEVLTMRVKEFKETDKGLIASIPQTKTGKDYRPCLCVFSSQYIRNHIAYSALNPDDLVFGIKTVAIWEMLRKIAKKAGITKPVHAHSFRHSQASDMVKRGYQESIIRKKLGWTGDSSMIERYVHLNDEDVVTATLEKTGTEIPKQPIVNMKQPEKISITDTAMQVSKLSEDNIKLKKQMELMMRVMEDKGLL